MSKKELTNEQKKDWAKLLYLKEKLTQKEIAAKVGTSEQTLCKWVKVGNWESLKKSLIATKQENISLLYNQLSEINKAIASRDEGKRYANAVETNTIIQLTTSIQKLETETSVSDIIAVSIGFCDFVREYDNEKGKEFSDHFDAYIEHKMR